MTPLTNSFRFSELIGLPNCGAAFNMGGMPRCPQRTLLTVIVSLASVLILAGCSATTPTSREPLVESVASSDSELPNMDELESDSSAVLLSSEEERARDLSALWLRHAARLTATSPQASLAAYLRAAHTSLSALASDSCSDPFNDTCAELRETYERALSATVGFFKAQSWQPFDLAPTRYWIDLATEPAELSLQSLAIQLQDNAPSSRGRRSGIGTGAVGCRSTTGGALPARSIDSCAPITFVLSFNASLRSEKITATLTAYDASRRAVVDVQGRELSLAANFGLSLDELAARAARDKEHRLFCIGTPSSTETTLIAAAHQSTLATVRDMLLTVLLDPELEDSSSVCIFPLRSGESPERAARALTAASRSISDEEVVHPLVPSPAKIFLVAEGEDGNETAAAFLARLSRGATAPQRNRGKSAVRLQGVYSLASARRIAAPSPDVVTRLDREAANLGVLASGPVLDGHPRTRAEQFREIRDRLALTSEITQQREESSGAATESPVEPLKLSPVF